MEITLTNGMICNVDADDYSAVAMQTWYINADGYARTYIQTGGKRITILMHRLLMKPLTSQQVDHINGNKLDNRRENLRLCTHAQNMANRGVQRNNTSGFKGVTHNKSRTRWIAQIKIRGKQTYLGSFAKVEDAALAYNKVALDTYKDFAKPNLV